MSIRFTFRALAVALSLATAGSVSAAEPARDLTARTVVLVHGAFADGSSWAKVIPLVTARGLDVVAVQNPLSSLEADIDATRRAIDQAAGPVVLVGHSWGGVVITEAGNDPKVEALVYVAAFAPDAGQSIASMTAGDPAPPYAPFLRKDEGGYLTLTEEGVLQNFAHDLPEPEAKLVAITQGPWHESCAAAVVTRAAWHDKPVFTVISAEDRMIPPALQEQMVRTTGAKATTVPSSHVVMLSHPREVADQILAAASNIE